ncbi:MAG: hypothetical protein UHD07_03310 [Ruminobacter sp.]|nr:hypothetical protein [Ruminobacter sp.]
MISLNISTLEVVMFYIVLVCVSNFLKNLTVCSLDLSKEVM